MTLFKFNAAEPNRKVIDNVNDLIERHGHVAL